MDELAEKQRSVISVQAQRSTAQKGRACHSAGFFSFSILSSEYQIQRIEPPKSLAWKAFCISVYYSSEAVET
jgi:hypothetical protein